MLARLANAVLYGLITAVVIFIIFSLLALPTFMPPYQLAVVIGVLVGIVVFFTGNRLPW